MIGAAAHSEEPAEGPGGGADRRELKGPPHGAAILDDDGGRRNEAPPTPSSSASSRRCAPIPAERRSCSTSTARSPRSSSAPRTRASPSETRELLRGPRRALRAGRVRQRPSRRSTPAAIVGIDEIAYSGNHGYRAARCRAPASRSLTPRSTATTRDAARFVDSARARPTSSAPGSASRTRARSSRCTGADRENEGEAESLAQRDRGRRGVEGSSWPIAGARCWRSARTWRSTRASRSRR